MLRFTLFALFTLSSFPATAGSAASSLFLVPGQKWGFQFESAPVESHRGIFRDGEYQLEVLSSSGLIVTMFVEPAEDKGTTAEECRAYFWGLSSRNPAIVSASVKLEVADEFELVSYTVEAEDRGVFYVQPNMNFYGYREGKCIDIHVSQAFPKHIPVNYENLELFRDSLQYLILK